MLYLLWNQKIHYHVCKIALYVPIMRSSAIWIQSTLFCPICLKSILMLIWLLFMCWSLQPKFCMYSLSPCVLHALPIWSTLILPLSRILERIFDWLLLEQYIHSMYVIWFLCFVQVEHTMTWTSIQCSHGFLQIMRPENWISVYPATIVTSLR